MIEVEKLQEKISKLEKEIESLKQVTIFSDIQPYIEENESKYQKVKITKVDLTYLVRVKKEGILKQLLRRIASDLYQDPENIQLLNPINGKVLGPDEDIQQFISKNDDFIRFDFQYASECNSHSHSHSHDYDSDDDFTDDENFYNNCSCAHPH